MRKERMWGKSVNRLLVLVLAVTVTLVFSFTSFSFADDSVGSAASGSESGNKVQSSDNSVSLEEIPSRLTYWTVKDSYSVSLKTGQTATIVRRPYKATRCRVCNSIVYACVPKLYYASDNAVKAVSSDGAAVSDAVKDAHFSLKSVTAANLPQFDGVQGLAFSFKGNRPGKYTVTYNYYFNYNSSGTGDHPVTCQNPECDNYQKEPSYDVGGDHFNYCMSNTIHLTVSADYQLTYDANGGTNAPEAAEIKDSTDSRQDFELSSDVPERKGYSFLGWSEDKDAKKADYKAGSKYTMTWPDTAKTLYAVWEKENSTPTNPVTPVSPSTPAENHTVIFHYNDGTTADVTQSVADGSQAVKPGNPSRDGYTFDGWYSDAELTKSYDFSTPVKNNVELYAKWTKKNETVNPEQPAVKGFLLPRVLSSGKTAQTLTWTKVDQADGYDVYFAKCNTAYHEYPLKKVTSVKASQTRTYRRTGLKYQTPYKYIVKAYRIVNGKKTIIASSVSVHSIAGNANAKYANVRAVKTTKKTVTVKKGGSLQLKASALGYRSGKQVLSKGHCPEIRYISRDKSIAAVTASGKVKGRKIGSVKVYILGSNGVRTDVTVKIVK
ncbi:MAG: InlB B-repeat-containing protein [Eubacterium sp.]|jgi:uncharacterized repeat protein (TIGR02543 family)|nr:InlB B-repeat-containing protein [Eubacterium sp.]MCI2197683.1 InlB B-repeat-containing protein [Eubacterium sp.]